MTPRFSKKKAKFKVSKQKVHKINKDVQPKKAQTSPRNVEQDTPGVFESDWSMEPEPPSYILGTLSPVISD